MTAFQTPEIPTWVVWGTAPETDYQDDGSIALKGDGVESRPLEIYFQKDGADMYIMRGIATSFQAYLGMLEPGGTISVMISRGQDTTEEQPEPPTTTGSFVINNPGGNRHVWDFAVERRKAVR